MRKLGVILTAIGWVAMLLVVSTDDYYVMELREYHVMNWRALLIGLVIAVVGVLIYRIGELREVTRP